MISNVYYNSCEIHRFGGFEVMSKNNQTTCTRFEFVMRVPLSICPQSSNTSPDAGQVLQAHKELEALLETGGLSERNHYI